MESWFERQARLSRLAECQLFFVGGAPRSGTTWLQLMLDAHPEVSCRGEGLFAQRLAAPLDALTENWRQTIEAKNAGLFGHSGGYPSPTSEDADQMIGTGVLLALDRQRGDRECRAVGEKTPENVFLFPRLRRLFPGAKFIGIARDPRDVLTSAWHMFHGPSPGEDERAAKLDFIRMALPSIDHGARAMLEMARDRPEDCRVVTYEAMHAAPAEVAAHLFAVLGVSTEAAVVAHCVERASFGALKRRGRGGTTGTPFLRKGAVGDWRSTFTPEMSDIISGELGWMYPAFGWVP